MPRWTTLPCILYQVCATCWVVYVILGEVIDLALFAPQGVHYRVDAGTVVQLSGQRIADEISQIEMVLHHRGG